VMGSSEVNHRWNTVNIDGKWYLVDVTLGSLFFLMPPERFLKTHLPEDDSYTLLPDYVGRIKWSEAYEKREKEKEESLKELSPSKR
jgi:transglutaminase/protease-like cytokinesis protein 3